MDRFQVHGSVKAGFEPVQHLFEKQMNRLKEEQGQLCVYHKGEKVVDLWGSVNPDDGFDADSLVTVFSSGKSLEAIVIAWLAGCDLVEYNAPISQYWPEFAANGKGEITVAQLMRHESGLANFDRSIKGEDLFLENIKNNAVGKIIEQQPLAYRSEEKREYHAITRGWVVNELVRRVDPQGRTIGELLKQEINQPLDADVAVGISGDDLQRIFSLEPLSPAYHFMQSLLPRSLGRRVLHNVFEFWARFRKLALPVVKAQRQFNPPPAIIGLPDLEYFNSEEYRRGETSSANASCSARGLAKVAAMMAAGGQFEGKEYLSSAAWKALHAEPVDALMGGAMPTRFTQGGVNQFCLDKTNSQMIDRAFNEGREGFYGWMGFGGSIFQWHPELDIGFAFAPTSLHYLDLLNERGKCFQAEVLSCVEASIKQ